MSFGNLSVILSCSYIWKMFLCRLIFTSSLFLLGKSATSPALKGSGLMEKRTWSALECKVPCSSEPGTTGVSPMCVVRTLLLWLSHIYPQSSHLQWLPLPGCEWGLVSVLLVGQSGAVLTLSWARADVWQRCRSTDLQGALFFPEKLASVGRANSQNMCLPSAPYWGQTGVRGLLGAGVAW